jgi:hypothetical protein
VRWLAAAVCAIAISAAAVAGAWAEDSGELRGYLQLKLRSTNNFTDVHDYYGFGLGVNLNRYLGSEQFLETTLRSSPRFRLAPGTPARVLRGGRDDHGLLCPGHRGGTRGNRAVRDRSTA